jgi:hypothetical protein
MTRRSSTSITGTRGRRPARAAVEFALVLALATSWAAIVAVAGAEAQTLQLRSLRLPPHDLVGTWVSFHGRAHNRGAAPREFDQRIAVVSKETLPKKRWGLWVELKTTDARGNARVERGLFAPPSLRGKDLLPGGTGRSIGNGAAPDDDTEEGEPPSGAGESPADFVLVRYQVLTGGRLYEYPVGSARHARSGGEVSSYELFEYDPSVTPIRANLGPDTLTLGRRVVPAVVERVRRYGSDRWPSNDDSSGIQRLVLTQTFWRNGAVPITGFARSTFQAEMRRLPWSGWSDSLLSGIPLAARPDSTRLAAALAVAAMADSLLRADTAADAGAGASSPAGIAASPSLLAWTELTLTDLGADAKPEITQEPELPPDLDEPDVDPGGLQR